MNTLNTPGASERDNARPLETATTRLAGPGLGRGAACRHAEALECDEFLASRNVASLRVDLAAEESVRVLYIFAALVTALVLLGLVALPAHAEPPRLTDARTAQTSCVLREYRTRTASAGVSAREAALVARLGAEHACALEGWARALGGVDALAVATATRAPVVCETAPAALACPEDRPTWIDVLSHGGACALCGGGVALGAWATCGGVR